VDVPVIDDTALLIEQIKKLAVVHGQVTLSSGRTADYYVDMRRVTLDGATAPVIGRVMRDLVADWDFDAVGGLTLGADPVATAMLHAAAAAGDRLASAVWDETIAALACGLTSLVNLFEPELVVIGGGVTRSGDQLLGPVQESVRASAMGPAGRAAEIVLSALGDRVGVVGAAAIAFDRVGSGTAA
jgi:hypothetical protein